MGKKIFFQRIDLIPSKWQLDVWVGGKPKKIAKLFHLRYGASVDYYIENYYPNRCMTLTSTLKSELKGRTQIVVQLQSFNEDNHCSRSQSCNLALCR